MNLRINDSNSVTGHLADGSINREFFSLIGNEFHVAEILLIGGMMFSRNDIPLRAIDLGKPGITLVAVFYIGDVEPISSGQRQFIDRTTTNDHRFVRTGNMLQRLLEGVCNENSLGLEGRGTGQHNVRAPRQRPADRFIGLSSHDDGFSHGQLFEMSKICRQMPGKLIIIANQPVTVHRRDN